MSFKRVYETHLIDFERFLIYFQNINWIIIRDKDALGDQKKKKLNKMKS